MDKHQTKQKYGLVWEEEKEPEEAVLACMHKRPVLIAKAEKSIQKDAAEPNHLLLEGDNYHGLLLLQDSCQEKIDLIYIDPPYNTGKGNEFLYNDRYIDVQDGYRHSKWLSFMERRLVLAKKLLKSSGAIFISIDDNEVAQLKLLCMQIFGEENFVAQFIRKNKAGSAHDSGQIAIEFDYMLCFAKDKSLLKFAKDKPDVENDKKYRYKDVHVDFRGKYYLRDLDYKGSYSESMDYPIEAPDGSILYSGEAFGKPNTWRWNKEKFEWGVANDFIVFRQNAKGWKVYIKQYQYVDNQNQKRVRELPFRAMIQFLNSEGSQELKEVVGQNIFKFPKPLGLIKFCLGLFEKKDIKVLDFFAGSGTTGHAVLKMNEADGGKRQFILCTNNENGICENLTYPRLAKVLKGYQGPKVTHAPVRGNLLYYKVDLIPKDNPDKGEGVLAQTNGFSIEKK